MKVIFALNHPAHFHLFKNSFRALRQKGHDVVFVIKDKDLLVQLMISEDVDFYKISQKRVGHSAVSILYKGFLEIIVHDYKLFRFVKKYKPDIMIGTDYCITHIGKLLGIHSIVLNEDDYETNKLFCLLSYPFTSTILTPTLCRVGKFKKKKIHYNGYQKLAYLHPEVFKPDINIVAKYFDMSKKYFIIRVVSLSAGHDINLTGMNQHTLEKTVNILSDYGNVYITADKYGPVCLSLAHHSDNGELWYVASDEHTDMNTFLEYGMRFDIEENFLDDKSNGFQLENSLIRSSDALSRLCFILSMATLYLVSQGTQVVSDKKRRWVDPHWFRGNSYLRIGWQWIKSALVHGWALCTVLSLNGQPDPEPAIASLRQANKKTVMAFKMLAYNNSA